MVSDRKRRRQLDAARQNARADLKKVYSLSFGLLRSDAAYEKFREEWSALQASGQTRHQIKASKISAVEQVQSNAFTRATDLLAFHLGALYAVAEKWREWNFADPEVDKLLNSPSLTILKKSLASGY